MYSVIRKHSTVRGLYAEQLTETGVINQKQGAELEKEIQSYLQEEYEKVASNKSDKKVEMSPPDFIVNGLPKVKTAVPLDELINYNQQLLEWPESFSANTKLEKNS